MRKRPTVVDVAKMAGVGPSTVSRYFRGVNISDTASQKVEHAVRKLGYEPDENARALRIGRSRSIGVILPRIDNAFFSHAVQTLEARARELGYTVLLLTHEDHPEEQAKQLTTLRRCGVDGAIVTLIAGTTLESVRKIVGELPLVSFDAQLSSKADAVVLQNRSAAKMATEHLIAHGHRRIGVVTAKPNVHSFSERLLGFSDAMQAGRLTPIRIIASDYDELRHLLRGMLAAGERPDALLALSDSATLNVIRIFLERQMPPGTWLPMIGFDDFDYAPLLGVAVTVVKQPVEEMIGSALALLMKRIEGNAPKEPQMIQIPGELLRRRSCGCS